MPFEERLLGDLPAISRRRVLVVDDDPSIVNLIKEDLESLGFQVSCGYDGQMAIQLAHQEHPDLIILDVNMPMTNGLRAFEYLRRSPATQAIPIIFVSGELSKDVYPVVATAQRVAHLKKPMDLEHLNSMVRQFIRQYPVPR
jgi:CheY-like chemotaxis protein